MAAFESTVYAERRAILDERMRQQNVDVLFCPPSGDLEYLTGARRRIPTFRQHLLHPRLGLRGLLPPRPRPGVRAPRMVAEFDMPTGIPGEFVVVNETDDGATMFEDLVRGFGPSARSPSSRARGPRRSSPSGGRATPRSSAACR